MAVLSFPFALADFWEKLPVTQMGLAPSDSTMISRTRGGEVLTAQLGNTLWQGTATLASRNPQHLDWVQARLQLLRRGGSFLVAPRHRAGPVADPDGVLLAGATPKIDDISLTRRLVRMIDLPAFYVLTPGDYLSYAYGSSLIRYGFHQLVTGAVASGAGIASDLELVPPIPAGITPTFAVSLVSPCFKAVLTEAPAWGMHRQAFLEDMAFSFIQTLGA